MGSVFAKQFSKNLAKPNSGLTGWYIASGLVRTNKVLEVNAARLCKIQPHHDILEVGFGPGLGIREAYTFLKDGTGQIYGIDISPRMVKLATDNMKEEIAVGKVHINLGDVENMPFKDNMFDSIFHTNCYYFWPDIDKSIKELHRVIKHKGPIVTTLNLSRLNQLDKKNLMQYGIYDPDRYMSALQRNGFENVHMKDITDTITFQAIIATARK
ncbi:YDAC-like protein [Mya arenaria]|uniref:YDAC-like protein n=1 Tax=Mya arenaria TaxID=6604 RepID=A0ABY7FR64_MYAAR|nr:ubiquinone/menaquinone biosynthesis C-methyltransferase UbiE-like [Mya arenaria]WAR23243.1 YDAC-like protein [Mya arenaria]